MDNELIAVESTSTAPQSIDLVKNESIIKEENTQALAVVDEILNNKPNPVMIKSKKTGVKKRHLEYEDWIALGNAFGLDVMTGDAEPVEVFEAKGFKAKAKLIRVSDGVVIGGAEAYCLDNEQNWLNKDYFQMASMAQTRAGSKALSNALRGIVALHKSLVGTPAEEMNGIHDDENRSNSSAPKPKPSKPQSKNSSNLGYKPKAPAPKPKLDDEAIEVEVTEVQKETEVKEPQEEPKGKPKEEPKAMSFKEICDSNTALTLAVQELQANEQNINHNTVHDKLLDLWDMGKINKEELNEAKQLLE